jgi:hypothetical protein
MGVGDSSGKANAWLEVSSRENVEASSLSRRIHFVGNLEDALPRGIEGGEYPLLGVLCPGIELEESAFINEERNFDGIVMSPKTDAPPVRVITATLIWKIKGHPKDSRWW